MKLKAVSGIMLTLLLVGSLNMAFNVAPGGAEVPIKVGVIGPMGSIQGQGMMEGATLAVEEINVAGGVLGQNLTLFLGDEGADPATGAAEMERLISVDGVDFVLGGFRTEIVFPMREVAMDHKKIFIMTGSATTELINCWQTPAMGCGKCVREDYDRYKYTFRSTPTNTTVMFLHVLLPYIKHYLIPKVMIPIFGKPIKVAVLVEMAAWTQQLRSLIIMGGSLFFSMVHPYNVTDYTAEIVYKSYPSPTATDFSVELQAIEELGAQLIFHVFSAQAGRTFIEQWGEMQIPAVPIGVNVLAQESSHWDMTGGNCEGEAFLSSPVRVNVTEKTISFWDNYVTRWGHDPIYTAFGAYDTVYALAEAIERAGTIDPDANPETDYVAGMNRTRGRLIKELEGTDRISTVGRFKFTLFHDVFVEPTKDPPRTGAYWYDDPDLPVEEISYVTWLSSEYVTPLIVQWQNGERVVVFPFNQTYTVDFQFLPWIVSPLSGDVNGDGIVNILDGVIIAVAFGTEPSDPKWNPLADIVADNIINIQDILLWAIHFGETW